MINVLYNFHSPTMVPSSVGDLPNNSGQNEQAWSFKYSHNEQERREPKLIFFGTLLLSLHTNISLIIHPVLNASQSN